MAKTAALLLLLVAAGANAASAKEGKQNPITRVAELLEGLSKKTEADGKAEEELFEKYQCWYKTVVSTKTISNAAAADRIEALTAYIDDVESGRIEFTSERGDLGKQLGDLNAEIEKSAAVRAKEHEDYLAAKDEMEKAIAALEKAVDVLGTTTADMKDGELLATKFDLRKVVDLGKSVLGEKDAQFLEKVLEVPEVDWKKLNRKATFKMEYKGRSFKIQEILADMTQTFQDNLAEAETKESDTEAAYQKLKAAKDAEKTATEQAASDMSKETASRNLAMAESNEERDLLTEQKTNDEGFIAQTEADYATKLGEWKERKRLRTEEVASISKAIGILTSDDARDLFKKSFDSQGYSLFLQEKQEDGCSTKHRARKAVALIRKVGTEMRSLKLAALATKIAVSSDSEGHFDAIIADLNEQVVALNTEEEADLVKKEQCEKDRQENTKIAKEESMKMDDDTAFIERKNEFIGELNKKIKDAVTEMDDLAKELQEARDQRALEKTAYEGNKAADEGAVGLIEQTMAVLSKFYEDNGLAFAQTAGRAQGPAGAAPGPPPTTWSAPYGGAKGESNGIQGILGLIKADVEKDISVATSQEEDAIKEFEALEAETATTTSELESQKAQFEEQVADAEEAIVNTESERADKKGVLDNTIALLKSIAPDCDYIQVNFEVRKKNRWAERDGLEKAKAILSGSTGEGFGFLQKKGC